MSGRKALLIGINYVGSENQLQVGDFEAFDYLGKSSMILPPMQQLHKIYINMNMKYYVADLKPTPIGMSSRCSQYEAIPQLSGIPRWRHGDFD